MTTRNFKIESSNGIAKLTFDWPKQVNSLGADFSKDCLAALDQIDAMDDLRVLQITGSGKVFCGGGDLFEIMGPEPQPIEEDLVLLDDFNRVAERIYNFRVPVIAVVNGPAVGGGAGIAMACDFAVASETARYDFFFGLLGLAAADVGVSWLLTKHLGPARANYYIYTAASIGAEECKSLGLFSEVVPPDQLFTRAHEVAEKVAASYSPIAASATKVAMRAAVTSDMRSAMAYDSYIQTVAFQSADHKTRIAEYRESLKKGRSK